MLTAKRLFIALLVAIYPAASACADKISDYKEYATQVRANIWGDTITGFTNPPAVPERYKNESAIILAAHKYIFAKKKTGIGFDRNAALIPIKRVALLNMDDYLRTLILINDKAALEQFSEYDLPTKSGSSDWFFQEKDERKYVLGVRIIKPDGRIIEVPTDDFVIISQQKKEDKADRQKLAVPGLEVGDKLDIVLHTHTALKNIQPDPIDIMLRQDYPVLSYTIDCHIDDDLTTIYRQRNGAPDLNLTQGTDKDYILTGAITEPIDAEPQLLYSPLIQSPHIEMLIYNRRFDQKPPKFARKDGVQANPDAKETVISDYIASLENYADMSQSVKMQLADVKGKPMKTVKEKLKKNEWTTAQTADYIYNLLVFSYMTGKYRYYPGDFVNELDAALRQAGIPADQIRKGITIARKNGPLDQAVNGDDIWYFVYLPATGQFYSNAFRGYNTSSEILYALQGQKAIFTHNNKLPKKERQAENREFTIPLNTPHDNRHITTLNVSIDGTDLDINRRVDAYGASKENVGPILTSDNRLNAYLEYLNRDGITADPQMLRKEKAKDKKQRMERNADESDRQSDKMRSAIEKYHRAKPKEFKSCEILAAGIGSCPDSSAISYTTDYVMDGLVKNAGRNIMLSIGNLIGEQPEILPSDRKRLPDDDVILSYPRENIFNIAIQFPQGYKPSASSLDKLNTDITNTTGHFTSKAEVNGDKILLTVSQEFSLTRMPASDWEQMLQLLDAAAQFNTLTLLLEKI